MMKKSPTHEQYQACYYEACGFDLHKDFSQLLEEAKQNVNEAKLRSSSVHPEEYGKAGTEKVKKDKKSWKSCVISWWKSNNKSQNLEEPTNTNNNICESNSKGHVSGPIYNCGKEPESDVKYRRPTSGPFTSLLKSTHRGESDSLCVSSPTKLPSCYAQLWPPLWGHLNACINTMPTS